MNKAELMLIVANNTGMAKKDVSLVVNEVFNAIRSALNNGDRVGCSGFGTFETYIAKERKGRNPGTGESVLIPVHKKVRFRPSENLKSLINE